MEICCVTLRAQPSARDNLEGCDGDGGGREVQEGGDNLEGCDGEGGGREVQEGGDTCIPVADSC